MLVARPGVQAVKINHSSAAPFNTLVFETHSLQAAIKELEGRSVKI